MKRAWYEKYIGYCFNDDGKEVILDGICCFQDENGKNKRTAYELYYPATNESVIVDYKEFMRIRKQTNLPH